MNTLAALQRELAKFQNLDPRAVEAIASHEGLGGGIGDNGTSFGPFQLHWGGAYPGFAPHGSPQAAQAWAWSPAGIDYALSRIQSVAGGMTGLPAIQAISTRFERPANPQAEIADAARHYGLRLSGSPLAGIARQSQGNSSGLMSMPMGSGTPDNSALILSLVQSVLSRNSQAAPSRPSVNPLAQALGV